MKYTVISNNNDGGTVIAEYDVFNREDLPDLLSKEYAQYGYKFLGREMLGSNVRLWPDKTAVVIIGAPIDHALVDRNRRIMAPSLSVHGDWGGLSAGFGGVWVRWEIRVGKDVAVDVSFDSEDEDTSETAELFAPRILVERDVRDREGRRVDYAAASPTDQSLYAAKQLLSLPRVDVKRTLAPEIAMVAKMPTNTGMLDPREREHWRVRE